MAEDPRTPPKTESSPSPLAQRLADVQPHAAQAGYGPRSLSLYETQQAFQERQERLAQQRDIAAARATSAELNVLAVAQRCLRSSNALLGDITASKVDAERSEAKALYAQRRATQEAMERDREDIRQAKLQHRQIDWAMATLDHLVLSSGRSLNARLERAEHLLAELASRPLAPLLIDRSLIGTLSIGSMAGRDHIEVTVTPVQPDDK